MKRFRFGKLLSILLAAVMVFSAAPALAAQAAERQTDYFTEQEHSELTYAEMEANYARLDLKAFQAELDKFTELAKSTANAAQLKEQYAKLAAAYNEAFTNFSIAYNAVQRDSADKKWAAEYEFMGNEVTEMVDSFFSALKKALGLPGGDMLRDFLDAALVEELLEYEEMTEEQLAMVREQNSLLQEYYSRQIASDAMAVKGPDGKEYTYRDLVSAYMQGQLIATDYMELQAELSKKQNEYLGESYLKLVELRKRMAKSEGYDNYGDLAYEAFGRDYTQESIQSFADAVKESIVEPYLYLSMVQDSTAEVLYQQFPASKVMGEMERYLPEISSEMMEAFQYLRDKKLYDTEYSDKKTSGAYTNEMPAYGSAFIFAQPNGNAYDFSTLIHEFGHFNQSYQIAQNWYDSNNLDICEVHSQGLEVLFFDYYDSIFGEDAGVMEEYSIGNLLSAYVTGCLVNELETYVYATDNVTLEQINQKFMALAKDYGIADENDPRTELYGWSNIPHIYQQPCYYISYATSVAAAFQIWEQSLTDYDKAVNNYLKFVSLGVNDGFVETVEAAGFQNPLDAASVKQVGDKIMEHYKLEERLNALYAPEQPEEDGQQEGDKKQETDKTDDKGSAESGSGKDTSGSADKKDTDKKDTAKKDTAKKDTAKKDTGKKNSDADKLYCYIREGDTLSKIGSRVKADWKEIAELNGIKSPYRIYAGDKLELPEGAVLPAQAYRVQSGDTLGKIAQKLGMDWRILAQQLGLEAPYTIYEGQLLKFKY